MKKVKYQSNRISWEEISCLENIFCGDFAGQKRNMWFKKAWQAMEKAGLTLFKDNLDKQRVLIRLMTLATIYGEFCQLAFDVPFFREGDTFEWIQQGTINRMHIWRLIDVQGASTIDVFDDLDYCLVYHTCNLIDGMRNEVYKALHQFYHNSDDELFREMLKTGYDPNKEEVVVWDEWECEYEDLERRMERAISWIVAGMQRSIDKPNNQRNNL